MYNPHQQQPQQHQQQPPHSFYPQEGFAASQESYLEQYAPPVSAEYMEQQHTVAPGAATAATSTFASQPFTLSSEDAEYRRKARDDEIASMIVFLVGLLVFFPVWIINIRYQNSISPTARTLAKASLIMLVIATLFLGCGICLAIVIPIIAAIASSARNYQ